jgi:hypothetical protein
MEPSSQAPMTIVVWWVLLAVVVANTLVGNSSLVKLHEFDEFNLLKMNYL